MAAAHQVTDLAFHLGPGGLVISLPGGAGLCLAGGGQPGLVRADGDRAAAFGGGALGGQRAGAAGRAEPGLPGVAVTAAGPDGRGDARGAGDGLAIKIDGEPVLGKVTFHRRWRLHLDAAVDAGVFHALNQLAGAVGGIAVYRRLAAAPASGPRPGRGDARFPAARSGPGAVLIAGQQAGDQALGGLSVPAVARGDIGGSWC